MSASSVGSALLRANVEDVVDDGNTGNNNREMTDGGGVAAPSLLMEAMVRVPSKGRMQLVYRRRRRRRRPTVR